MVFKFSNLKLKIISWRKDFKYFIALSLLHFLE